ncbi:Signal transduction histidine kinase [Lishizhenia tianjinensis]|uniref:histidine kinase n=1 Tax=Lishizhenia tianjinensis TaxID=477690 RepID=A0A1I6XMN7_9FLAO|nr:HAMP domain-containing sensor histidine kinase [Lishizhenia tianjinensis]SFT39699.1 Signal transduction histidine kinase [Lishizhenia tianjinensis]
MNLYAKLSKVGFLKNYASKFLAVAFLGIHVPLIGIILFVIFNEGALSSTSVIVLTLLLTLAATGVTLYVLNKLLAPLKLAKSSLKNYLENQEIPQLPLDYKDEVGELLKDLQFSIQTLDQLLETKQNTIEVLSHDLRSPSITINMLTDMLQKKKSDEEKAVVIEHIKTTVNEQLQLISSTLENLKNETQTNGKLHKEQLKLKEILLEVIASQKVAMENKNIQLNFNPSSELPFTGNEAAFRQVFANLINNAIKFSELNSEIKIIAKILDKEMHIDFVDQGLGFDKKDAEALFKPFTEHSRKGTQDEMSGGMGLFISRRFINKHSGTLEASSEGPNKGSTFSIQLPLN